MVKASKAWSASQGDGYHVFTDVSPEIALCGYELKTMSAIDSAIKADCQICHQAYLNLLEEHMKGMTQADFWNTLDDITAAIIPPEIDHD